MKNLYDFLIVGHGLAGAVLSHDLLDRGYHVMVLDQSSQNKTSRVAAGLYNPITGRNMVKTWLADELFPMIEPHYEKLEKKLGARFLHKIGIYRPFANTAEQNDWAGRQTDPNYQNFIESATSKPHTGFKLSDPHGGLHLNVSGYVDVAVLLDSSHRFLEKEGRILEEGFEESELVIEDDCTYKHIKAKNIIFCNGIQAMNTNLFGWLPFRPVKGEVLSVRFDNAPTKIHNRGIFILPVGEDMTRVGSTYKNSFTNIEPTESGKIELVTKLDGLTLEKHEVVGQVAGIRPATKDRRPFIGKHPEYEHIYVFNGFGSKGVSMIPFFSTDFIEHMEGNSPLYTGVDVSRYADMYPNGQ